MQNTFLREPRGGGGGWRKNSGADFGARECVKVDLFKSEGKGAT